MPHSQLLLFLLLPCLTQVTHTGPTVPKAHITGDWNTIVARRIAELRQTWPNCIMNEQNSWLPYGASLIPNATVFEDIWLRATDVDSKTAITTYLERQKNGSVYWELVVKPIRDPWIKPREVVGWKWGVNNTVGFNEAVRIVAKAAAGKGEFNEPGEWMMAFQERYTDDARGGWPDQLYWKFLAEYDWYLGQQDRIVRFIDEPDSKSARFGIERRRLGRGERKKLFAETGMVRREDLVGDMRRTNL